MEITTMQLYWIMKLDNIITLFQIVSFASFITILILSIFVVFDTEEDSKKYIKTLKWSSVVLFVSVLSWTFTPTTNQLAALIVVPKIINNEQVQEIPQKLLDLGIQWLNKAGDNIRENRG